MANTAADLNSLLTALPQLKDLLNLQVQTAEQQTPLRTALSQLALNLLPKSSRAAFAGVPDLYNMSPYSPGGGGGGVGDGGGAGNSTPVSADVGGPISGSSGIFDNAYLGASPQVSPGDVGPKTPLSSHKLIAALQLIARHNNDPHSTDLAGWNKFFAGNPGNAFHGGDVIFGSGDQSVLRRPERPHEGVLTWHGLRTTRSACCREAPTSPASR